MNWKRCRKCAVLSMAPVRWFSENTTQTCSEASSPWERRIFATAPDVLHIVSCWLLVYPTISTGSTGMQCFICSWKQRGAADLSWFLRRKKKKKKCLLHCCDNARGHYKENHSATPISFCKITWWSFHWTEVSFCFLLTDWCYSLSRGSHHHPD